MHQSSDLRVIICEDEYLLATDLAAELKARGATIVGIMARSDQVVNAMGLPEFNANAAVLDVKLLDGTAFDLVGPMLSKGMAVVFCTGYVQADLPDRFAMLPRVGKPTDIDQLLAALHSREAKGESLLQRQ